MNNKVRAMLFASLIGEAISGFTADYAAALEDKKNWRITIDFMMIIGKYFESNKDYVNIMKVNKTYEELVLMYRYNPISDPSLFENIQTQHFYEKEDVNNKKAGLSRYIYWMSPKYAGITSQTSKEIFKKLSLNKQNYSQLSFVENGNCTISYKVDLIETLSFYGGSSINNITLPRSVKKIEEKAFNIQNCSFIVPATLKTVGYRVFGDYAPLRIYRLPT